MTPPELTNACGYVLLTNVCGCYGPTNWTCTNTAGPYVLDTNVGPNVFTNACGFVIFGSGPCPNADGPYYPDPALGSGAMTNACGEVIYNYYPTSCTNQSGPYLLDTNDYPIPVLTNACGFIAATNMGCTNANDPFYLETTLGNGNCIYTNDCGFVAFTYPSCPNPYGNYTLDTNVSDVTWGTLTNKCGYAFIPFGFASTNYGTNYATGFYLTNVPYLFTNQLLGGISAVISGAGDTNVNGTYLPSGGSNYLAPAFQLYSAGYLSMTNTINGKSLSGYGGEGTGCSGGTGHDNSYGVADARVGTVYLQFIFCSRCVNANFYQVSGSDMADLYNIPRSYMFRRRTISKPNHHF